MAFLNLLRYQKQTKETDVYKEMVGALQGVQKCWCLLRYLSICVRLCSSRPHLSREMYEETRSSDLPMFAFKLKFLLEILEEASFI